MELLCQKIREDVVRMIYHAKSGHPGGSLSIVELCAVLFFKVLRNFGDERVEDRDRFVLSKGHGVPTVYACLSRLGLIPPEELKTLRQLGSRLQGHPDAYHMPCLEASTGSLGQGVSIAQGLALGLQGSKAKVYCILGDGEIQEGQIWEVLLSAPKFHLSHFVVILDYNKYQIDGTVAEVMPIEPLKDKLHAFSWEVSEIDGHDPAVIESTLLKSCSRPHFVIAHTIKGKGVSFMQNHPRWHGSAPTHDEFMLALKEWGSVP